MRVEVVEEEGVRLGRSDKVGRRGVDEALVDRGRGWVGVSRSWGVALAWRQSVAGLWEDLRGSSETESRGAGGGERERASRLSEVCSVDVRTRRDLAGERRADAGRMRELQIPISSVPATLRSKKGRLTNCCKIGRAHV